MNVWRDVLPEDRGELWRLDRAIKGVDGAELISERVDEALSADHALCLCLPSGAIVGVGYVKGNTIGGGVRPEYRRRGVGTRLLEWTLERAPRGVELTIGGEALTSDAHALYVRHGFKPRMTETRMVRTLSAEMPDVDLPAGVKTVPWTSNTTRLFFAAYRASFADRPGFPIRPRTNGSQTMTVKRFSRTCLGSRSWTIRRWGSSPSTSKRTQVGSINSGSRRNGVDVASLVPCWRVHYASFALHTSLRSSSTSM